MRKIGEEGVKFSSPINGDKLFLTSKESMCIQHVLNSGIGWSVLMREPREAITEGRLAEKVSTSHSAKSDEKSVAVSQQR